MGAELSQESTHGEQVQAPLEDEDEELFTCSEDHSLEAFISGRRSCADCGRLGTQWRCAEGCEHWLCQLCCLRLHQGEDEPGPPVEKSVLLADLCTAGDRAHQHGWLFDTLEFFITASDLWDEMDMTAEYLRGLALELKRRKENAQRTFQIAILVGRREDIGNRALEACRSGRKDEADSWIEMSAEVLEEKKLENLRRVSVDSGGFENAERTYLDKDDERSLGRLVLITSLASDPHLVSTRMQALKKHWQSAVSWKGRTCKVSCMKDAVLKAEHAVQRCRRGEFEEAFASAALVGLHYLHFFGPRDKRYGSVLRALACIQQLRGQEASRQALLQEADFIALQDIGLENPIDEAIIRDGMQPMPSNVQEVADTCLQVVREALAECEKGAISVKKSRGSGPSEERSGLGAFLKVLSDAVDQGQGAAVMRALEVAASLSELKITDEASLRQQGAELKLAAEQDLADERPEDALDKIKKASACLVACKRSPVGELRDLQFFQEEAEMAVAAKEGHPKPPSFGLKLKGTRLYAKGEFGAAKEILSEALALQPEGLLRVEILLQFGMACHDLGEHSTALKAYREAEELLKDHRGPETEEHRSCWNNLACVYTSTGELTRAKQLLLSSTASSLTSSNHVSYSQQLLNLSSVYEEEGRYKEAFKLMLRAFRIHRRIQRENGLEDLGTTRAFYLNLGTLYLSLGIFDKAKRLLEKAEKLTDPGAPETAFVANNLGSLYEAQGDYETAKTYLQIGLDVTLKVQGPDSDQYATSLNNMAAVCLALDEFEEAQSLLDRASAICERQLGSTHSHYAISLNNLSGIAHACGRMKEAEELVEKACDVCKAAVGVENTSYAVHLQNHGKLLLQRGAYDKAESKLRLACEIHHKVLGPNHPGTAQMEMSLGQLYAAVGDYKRAERHMCESADMYMRAFANAPNTTYATALQGLAVVQAKSGRREKALDHIKKAEQIFAENLGKSHTDYAQCLTCWADIILLIEHGDKKMAMEEARTHLNQAIVIFTRKCPKSQRHPWCLSAVESLAKVALQMDGLEEEEDGERQARMERLEKAKTQARMVRDLYQEELGAFAGGHRHPSYTRSSELLGEICLRQARLCIDEDHVLAQVCLEEAFRILIDVCKERRLLLSRTMSVLPSWKRKELEQCNNRSLHLCIESVLELEKVCQVDKLKLFVRECYEVVAEWKHLLFNSHAAENLVKQALHKAELTEEQKKQGQAYWDDLRLKREVLARWWTNGEFQGKDDIAKHAHPSKEMQAVEEAEKVLTAWLRSINAALEVEPHNLAGSLLEDMTAALASKTGAALVEYFLLQSGRYVAFVVCAEDGQLHVKLLDLGEANRLDFEVEVVSQSLTAREKGQSHEDYYESLEAEQKAQDQEDGKILYEALLEPVLGALKELGFELKHLFIAPDGTLHILSFVTLPLPPFDNWRYVVHLDFTISYLYTGRFLLNKEHPEVQASARCLISAGPLFDEELPPMPPSESEQILRGMQVLRRGQESGEEILSVLHHAKREADVVFELFSKAFGVDPECHFEEGATRRAFVDAIGRTPAVIHVITHALHCLEAGIEDAEEEDGNERSIYETMLAPHPEKDPLLCVALAFAGASHWIQKLENREAIPKDFDCGILMALHLRMLPLSGTRLLFLAACQTARGQVQAGQGTIGLGYAALLAGVNTVLLSTMDLLDAFSPDLTESFYIETLQPSNDPYHTAKALQQAQRDMIHNKASFNPLFKYPAFWGGLQVHGSPGPIIPAAAAAAAAPAA